MLDDIYEHCLEICPDKTEAKRRFINTCKNMWGLSDYDDDAYNGDVCKDDTASNTSFDVTWMPLKEFFQIANFRYDGYRTFVRSGKPMPTRIKVGRNIYVNRSEVDEWMTRYRIKSL